MKASYQWLRALVPQLTASPKALAARFTQAGLEVEGMHEFGEGTEACLVVAVVSTRPHPSKSGLKLVTVDRGGDPLEIVCGAPNVPPPGGLVVLAPLGTHLPAKGMTIERRAIAGVVSEGMLCSEEELGLTEDAAGILVLPAGSAKPGEKLVAVFPSVRDTILEIGLGPNRPDGLGHIGLAREAAALFGLPFALPAIAAPAKVASGSRIDSLVKVAVEDAERCPHYGAKGVVDVTIGPSPLWLRYRLASLGVRSISNVVDITNYVMLEYGHPMHAFDLDLVRGAKIVVRRAREGEAMTTLDGVARTLAADDLVIADGQEPVGLAGVMGAANSEIRAQTKRVLFECAYFEPRGIRRASRRHGLHTESSHRFERGVDPGDVEAVLARAESLASELAGGGAVPGAIHVRTKPLERLAVTLRSARLTQIVGVEVPWKEAVDTLGRLGFELRGDKSSAKGTFAVPTHRPDIAREIDLIEEVARVRGFDSIPAILPAIRPTREGSTRDELMSRARAASVAEGLSEAVTYGFLDEATLTKMGAPRPAVRVKNPLNENQAVMRTSLVPGLLRSIDLAARRGERDARLFTLGSIFLGGEGDRELPEERATFAAVIAGERAGWLAKPEPVDVWDGKGIATAIVRALTNRAPVVRPFGADRPIHLHPRGAAEVSIAVDASTAPRSVGRFGLLHPDVRAALALEVPGDIVVVELDLAAIAEIGRAPSFYRPIPRLPASARDLAVVVRDDVAAGEVEAAVRQAAGPLAEEVRLFDRFTGGAIPPEHTSLAFRVVYRSPDRTLTDAEVDAQHGQVLSAVKARFGATLRDGTSAPQHQV